MPKPARRASAAGRPLKQPHERRIASIRADLTIAEKEHVRLLAAKAGLTEAELTRRAVLGLKIRAANSNRRSGAALISELNRIGNNVNQLARTMNRGRALPDYWRAIGEQLAGLLEKIAREHDP